MDRISNAPDCIGHEHACQLLSNALDIGTVMLWVAIPVAIITGLIVLVGFISWLVSLFQGEPR